MKNLIDDTDIAAAKRVFPIGRPVKFQPIADVEEYEESIVRSDPWRLGSGQIVVLIEGRSGGVSIDHLQLT